MAYGTRRFNAAFTRALQWSLFRVESTQFLVLILISLRSILTLSSHLRLGLPKCLFPVGLPVKTLIALLPFSILTTWPAHLNVLDLITLTILSERYKLWSSSFWSLLHSPFSSLLGPNIRLRILFSNTLSLQSYLNLRDHVSQPYSTTGNDTLYRNIIIIIIIFQLFLKINFWMASAWKKKGKSSKFVDAGSINCNEKGINSVEWINREEFSVSVYDRCRSIVTINLGIYWFVMPILV